jgi:hypothetical protein
MACFTKYSNVIAGTKLEQQGSSLAQASRHIFLVVKVVVARVAEARW